MERKRGEPWVAGATDKESLSGSVSLARTATSTVPSSATVAESALATGGSLTGVTVMVAIAAGLGPGGSATLEVTVSETEELGAEACGTGPWTSRGTGRR